MAARTPLRSCGRSDAAPAFNQARARAPSVCVQAQSPRRPVITEELRPREGDLSLGGPVRDVREGRKRGQGRGEAREGTDRALPF